MEEKEMVTRYQEDGAVLVRSAVSGQWVQRLRQVVEIAANQVAATSFDHVTGQNKGRFFEDQFMWRRNPEAREFVFHGPLSRLAGLIMGSQKVRLFYDHILSKDPGTTTPTPWHNDMSYWHLNGSQVCSMWLALDHVERQTCVQYWKGSHLVRLLHKVTSLSGDQTYPECHQSVNVPDVDSLSAEGKVELLHWDMEPGDVLVHQGFTIHGAPGNVSSERQRRGYVTRWIGDDVTFDARPGTINPGWVALGLDNGLTHGQPLDCELHPLIYTSDQF